MMKKKNILMLAAAAAVLCAVICVAGCVNSVDGDEADVLGTWYHGDDKLEVIISLNEDGTGMIACFKDDDDVLKLGVPVPYVNDVLWDAEGDSLSVLFDNGAETLYTIDKETGKLTSKQFGIVYRPIHVPKTEEAKLNPVGTWYTDDGNFEALLIFLKDGTGMFVCLKDDAGKYQSPDALPQYERFVWDEKEGTLNNHYEDGSIVTAVIDKKTGKLIDSFNTAYERAGPSESAGQFIGTWYFDDGKSLFLLLIADDGTGMFVCLKDDAGKYQSPEALPQYERFVWEEKAGTLNNHYEDGSIVTAVIDKKTGKLIDSFNTAYERIV